MPVRVKKTRQTKNLEPRSDLIEMGLQMPSVRNSSAVASQWDVDLNRLVGG
jgi:hypothetical protein